MEDCAVLDKYRRVAVSRGKLRFVDMYKNRSSFGSAQISVWTLADPDSTEWTLEYEATFSEIFNDASFKATRLTRQLPVLALIHPRDPDVVYFFLDRHLFSVDVPDRRVVQCELYELVEELSSERIATRFVHAWRLPPALRSAADAVADKLNAGGNQEIIDAAAVSTCQTEVEVGGGDTPESKRRRLE